MPYAPESSGTPEPRSSRYAFGERPRRARKRGRSLFPRFVSRTRLKQFNRTRRVALTGFHKGQNHWNVEFILPGAHRETLGQIVGQILGLSQFTCARESISRGNRLVTLTKAGLGHEHATAM